MATTNEEHDRESGSQFMPRFNENGLLAAMAVDHASGSPLLLAWMNAEALALTQETGFAYYWSRSRKALWKKGETSGHVLRVIEILVDCDQDALVLRCEPAGPACHTGAAGCFYRRLEDGRLVALDS